MILSVLDFAAASFTTRVELASNLSYTIAGWRRVSRTFRFGVRRIPRCHRVSEMPKLSQRLIKTYVGVPYDFVAANIDDPLGVAFARNGIVAIVGKDQTVVRSKDHVAEFMQQNC